MSTLFSEESPRRSVGAPDLHFRDVTEDTTFAIDCVRSGDLQTPDALEKLTAVTDAQKRDALKKLIDKHTEENTVSKKAARDTLIREGIYDRHGKLRVEFGGTAEKKTAAA